MAKKANLITPAPITEVQEQAELLQLALEEKLTAAENAAKAHAADIEAKANEASAWQKLQAEITSKSWLIEVVGDLPIDFGMLSKQAELGVASARVALQHAEAERDVDPLVKIHVAVREHQAAERKAKAAAHKATVDQARTDLETKNSAWLKAARESGDWATLTVSARDELINSAKKNAHKGLEKGTKAPFKAVRAELAKILAARLSKAGLVFGVEIEGTKIASKVADAALKEAITVVDPPRQAVAGNVRSGQRRNTNASNPKGQRRDEYAHEKPDVDAGDLSDVEAYFLSQEEAVDGTPTAMEAAMGKALDALQS